MWAVIQVKCVHIHNHIYIYIYILYTYILYTYIHIHLHAELHTYIYIYKITYTWHIYIPLRFLTLRFLNCISILITYKMYIAIVDLPGWLTSTPPRTLFEGCVASEMGLGAPECYMGQEKSWHQPLLCWISIIQDGNPKIAKLPYKWLNMLNYGLW